MTDQPEPQEVLRRIEQRKGKSDDPFAVHKLEEMAGQLRQAIEKYEQINNHLKVTLQGHKEVQSDESEAIAESLQQKAGQQEQQMHAMAAQLADLLDAAEAGRNLTEYLEEQQRQQEAARRAQMQQPQVGPQ